MVPDTPAIALDAIPRSLEPHDAVGQMRIHVDVVAFTRDLEGFHEGRLRLGPFTQNGAMHLQPVLRTQFHVSAHEADM